MAQEDTKYITINPFNIKDLLRIIKKKFLLIGAITLIGTIIAFYMGAKEEPVYKKSYLVYSYFDTEQIEIILSNLSPPSSTKAEKNQTEQSQFSKIISMEAEALQENYVLLKISSYQPDICDPYAKHIINENLIKNSFLQKKIERRRAVHDSSLQIIEGEIQKIKFLKKSLYEMTNKSKGMDILQFYYSPLHLIDLKKEKVLISQELEDLETPFSIMKESLRTSPTVQSPDLMKKSILGFAGSLIFSILLAVFIDRY